MKRLYKLLWVACLTVAPWQGMPPLDWYWNSVSASECSINIFAGEDWYQSQTEPEQRFAGKLIPRKPPVGPGARSTLRFTLVTKAEQYAVYVANLADKFERFSNRDVVVRAKLVRLYHDGLAPELWIGVLTSTECGRN